MSVYTKKIIKRDGTIESFSRDKILRAITRAFKAVSSDPEANSLDELTQEVCDLLNASTYGVEEIQDVVESVLMKEYPIVARKYIVYREWRTNEREKKTTMKEIMDGIVSVETNDINNENANMSSATPSGQMMTFASEITKDYTFKYLLPTEYGKLHKEGYIHIHDLDYYPTKTTTCLQYDLAEVFSKGFVTKNGYVRPPQSIQSYATLATIIFQTNQNEQHGGQSIPAFDFFMAPGVLKTYRKHILENLKVLCDVLDKQCDVQLLKGLLNEVVLSIQMPVDDEKQSIEKIKEHIQLSINEIHSIFNNAYEKTKKDTYQAMEGFIHNLNTMHSRGGNQVVFSSVNYGTDTSPEGRMVINELLDATVAGLGRGETPVFPIQIFKVKNGVSFSKEDCDTVFADAAFDFNIEGIYKAPNFDLLLKAVKTTSIALFPNFVFLDTPFNQSPLWDAHDPKRYVHEVTTMGCRTRVFENLYGEKSSLGRGNLSFTTLNLPRLALLSIEEAHEKMPAGNKHNIEKLASEIFISKVTEYGHIIAKQLKDRLNFQKSALAKQFPFMLRNNIWKGGAALKPNDTLQDVLNSGTLAIGFIGGHNAMMAIYGEGHATNKHAYDTLYRAIEALQHVAEEHKRREKLNYSVIATPAEGLSGRFTRLDRHYFDIVEGVNDRDYYVNSFHVDVREHMSVFEKIEKEAPFHALTLGGHITYVELDGEAQKNSKAILKIIQQMYHSGIGYGSINHPVDTCLSCGYKGIIYTRCPVCDSENISRMRRITGYLTGSLESWNSAKRSEELDRVKHGF